MRKLILSSLLAVFIAATCTFTCGQNGPTPPSVSLTWTQSITSGITANCVYRGTVTKVYIMPALFCSSAPLTAYVDNSVTRGTKYFYAVTAKVAATESAYSNEVIATIPASVAPPILDNPTTAKLESPGELPTNLTATIMYVNPPESTPMK